MHRKPVTHSAAWETSGRSSDRITWASEETLFKSVSIQTLQRTRYPTGILATLDAQGTRFVNRRAIAFLILYVAVLLYLSLYPWRFVAHPGSWRLSWVALTSRRTVLDAFLNVVFYMPLGAAAFASFRRGVFAFGMALAIGIVVSLTVELSQLSIPNRNGNLTDLASNAVGAWMGAGIAFLATTPPLASRLRVLHSPAILLVGLWALWQAMTLLPRYGPPIDWSHEIVGVLVLACLVFPKHTRAAGPVLLVWLSVDELRPFRFQGPPQTFLWIPFESWFVGAADTYYGTFFRKLFLYTAILWLEPRSGIRRTWALALPGAVLAAGEFAQCYLPGRTPESTDLFLLAAGAVLLRVVEP